jgi:hypothetical protein
MKSWIKKHGKLILGILFCVILVGGIYSYYHIYIPHKHLKEGFVIVQGFDCPSDHPIKAHLGSMIYHVPFDPYYRRTSASNGECFDTVDHAIKEGFRAPFN